MNRNSSIEGYQTEKEEWEMKEYKFERVEVKGLPGLYSKAKEDYRGIIRNHAQEGWELVQIFTPLTSVYGGTPYFEIIFSKDV